MSKRMCPFEDNYAPQLKIHVSSIDVDKESDEYMRNIYDKTIKMLFEASSKSSVHDVPEQQCTSTCIECNKSITSKCNCCFCEITLCAGCKKTCSHCKEEFCSRCSVAIYKNGDSFTCLTCYT